MSEGKDPADGRPSLRRFGAAFLGLLHGHVELFGIELRRIEPSARVVTWWETRSWA